MQPEFFVMKSRSVDIIVSGYVAGDALASLPDSFKFVYGLFTFFRI